MSQTEPPTVPNSARRPPTGQGNAPRAATIANDHSVPQTRDFTPLSIGRASVDPAFGPPLAEDDLGSFGPYRILKPLGKGGMGTVYLAEDTRLGRQIALKLCQRAANPSALQRFRSEARAAAALRHPNLCPVFESDVIDGVPYFTMALIDGPTLDRWADKRGGLSPRDAALLTRKLALAMHFAHERGVIHRDLKPANVAMERNEPVILDFGLARHGDARQTMHGTIMGTPAYMAPEQVKGDGDSIGPACDIYSLGTILYELLCGRVPFDGPPLTTLGQVVNSPPPLLRERLPNVDPALEAICMRCLEKDSARRWPDMAALAAALTDWVKGKGDGSGPTKAAKAAVAPSRKTAAERTLPATDDAEVEEPAPEPTEVVAPPRRARGARGRKRQSASWKLPVLAGVGVLLFLGLLIGVIQMRRSLIAPPPSPPPPDAVAVNAPPQPNPPANALPNPAPNPPPPKPEVAKALPSLRVSSLAKSVSLVAGGKQTLLVRVKREGVAGPVAVDVVNLPPKVTAKAGVIPEGADTIPVELSAAADAAALGEVERTASIVASTDNLTADQPLSILVTAAPSLRLTDAPQRITLRAGQRQQLSIRIERRACKGDVRVKLEGLPAGIRASDLVLRPEEDQGQLEVSAGIERAEKADVMVSATLRVTLESLTDSRPIQFTLEKREAVTATTTARGFYLHELEPEGPMVGLIVPGNRPVRYRVATGVEVRVPTAPPILDAQGNSRPATAEELKALRGDGKLPGYKAALTDLQMDRYVLVEFGKDSTGATVVRSIAAATPPPGYPPPPPPGPGRPPPPGKQGKGPPPRP